MCVCVCVCVSQKKDKGLPIESKLFSNLYISDACPLSIKRKDFLMERTLQKHYNLLQIWIKVRITETGFLRIKFPTPIQGIKLLSLNGCHFELTPLVALSGVYTSNLFNNLVFYLGQKLSLYETKYLSQTLSQTFYYTEGRYLAQI